MPPPLIDLRSDASSTPTPEIRRAMAEAQVGNDDFGEDPSVARLQRDVATLLGKEDAVFVQSGTMGNLVAVMAQTEPGQALITSPHFHVFDVERAAIERVAGCGFCLVADEVRGAQVRLHIEELAGVLDPDRTARLLCLENTVNRLGGTILHPDHSHELYRWANRAGLRVHLDGARLFNAASSLGVTPAVLADNADTVMVVFTKALAAPAGAAVAGDRATVERARRFRWMVGGAWKQGGVLAAACLSALSTMRGRVGDDHRTARRLAEGLSAIDGLDVDLDRVVTNIVYFRVTRPDVDVKRLKAAIEARGVRIGRFKEGNVCRLVTHKDIDESSVDRFLEWVESAVRAEAQRG